MQWSWGENDVLKMIHNGATAQLKGKIWIEINPTLQITLRICDDNAWPSGTSVREENTFLKNHQLKLNALVALNSNWALIFWFQ